VLEKATRNRYSRLMGKKTVKPSMQRSETNLKETSLGVTIIIV
jgi:hypothetical protein